MQSTTVRVNPTTHKVLANLAEETHSSIQTVLREAVETYRREVFLERTNQAYAELKKNPKTWAEYQKEMAAWDHTAKDGL
ncbi:MAG: toxin-antitoxin system protein [Verrucomicrobia bacterium]|nr:toxin-antitoxin system protein [Verrucomicrobiota bacterium]